MAEFSKVLSDPSVPSMPQVQTNTGSDVGDAISALNFGVSLFNKTSKDADEVEALSAVDKLRDLELQVLEQNKGNPNAQFKAARKVDATIKEMFGNDPRKSETVRSALASLRGGRVKNTIQQGLVDASVKAERDISSQFNDIKSLNPVFVQLNLETLPDGSITTEAKQVVIQEWKEFTTAQQQAQQVKQKALESQTLDDNTRITEYANGVTNSINSTLPMLVGNLSKTLTGIVGGESTPEGVEAFTQVKRNTANAVQTQKAQVEMEFGKLLSTVKTSEGRQLLMDRKEAIIGSLDTWNTLLQGATLDEAKQITQLATTMQQGLKINAMQSAPALAGITEALGSSVTTALVQEATTRDPQLRENLVGGVSSDLLKLSGSFANEGDGNLRTLSAVVGYPQGAEATPEARTLAYKSSLIALKNTPLESMGDVDKEAIAKTTVRFFGEAAQAPELSNAQGLLGQMLDPKLNKLIKGQPSEVQEAFSNSTATAAYRVLNDPKHGLKRVMDKLKSEGIKVRQGDNGKIQLLPSASSFKVEQASPLGFRFQRGTERTAEERIKVYTQAIDVLLLNKDLVVGSFGEEGFNSLLGIKKQEGEE
jgi:hypothetical protein